jgi:tRNA1Val (adenine37-N6)-methyltransferase
LLAAFAATGKPARRLLDLGAGTGVVGLCLLRKSWAERATLVEADALSAELLVRNVTANKLADRAEARAARIENRGAFDGHGFDAVVMNPPYGQAGRGRPAAPERRAAREGDLSLFARAARRGLTSTGTVYLCYPARELAHALSTLRAAKLEPKRMRLVFATEGAMARLALIAARAGNPGALDIEPPLVERVGNTPSAEGARLLSGNFGPATR